MISTFLELNAGFGDGGPCFLCLFPVFCLPLPLPLPPPTLPRSLSHPSLLTRRWDVHVLTGSLKLFFRELARPLIPWAAFLPAAEILKTTGGAENKSGASKIKKILGDKVDWSLSIDLLKDSLGSLSDLNLLLGASDG